MVFQRSTNAKNTTKMSVSDFIRDDITNLTHSPEKYTTALHCQTVRIGTFRFEPKEPILFTSRGIRLVAPVLQRPNELVELNIHNQEVFEITAHFSKVSESLLCFYVLRKCAQYIKSALNMKNSARTDGIGYFSYKGPNQFRKIIFHFNGISDQTKSIIKSLWTCLDEISVAEAQELQTRAAECDRQLAAAKKDENSAASSNHNDVRPLLIYPQGKGGIPINTEDYMCLAADQYLNDVIIDFYLKWLHNNLMPEGMREKTFIFSTFFYKRLTTRHAHDKMKQSAAQERHARVQNWTKNVNLFEKDFIIIPINEQSHWFLAIVCFPKLKGPVTFDTNVPVEPNLVKKQRGKKISLQIGNTTITPLLKRENNIMPEVCGLPGEESERDEAEGDESDLASEDSENDNSQSAAPTLATINNASNSQISGNNSSGSSNNNSNNNSNTSSNSNNSNSNGNASGSSNTIAQSQSQQTGQTTGQTSNSQTQPPTPAIKQPLILIFDSLAGPSRSRVVATLRDYLTCEYKVKMPDAPVHAFNKDNMPGHCVKVPQQHNFTDCGIYLLQYVEHFFKDPIRDYRLPIKQLNNWFDTLTVTRKREDISKLLQTLINETGGGQKPLLPEIPLPTVNGQPVETNEGLNVEFEEEELEEEGVEEEEETLMAEEMETDDMTWQTGATPTGLGIIRRIVIIRRFQIGNGETEISQFQTHSCVLGKRRKTD